MTTPPICRLRVNRLALIPTILALMSFAGGAVAQQYQGCYVNGQQVSDSMCNGGASGGGSANSAMMGAAGSLGFAIGAGIGGAIRNMLLDNNNGNGAPTARQLNDQGIALFNQGRLQEAAELFRRSYNADHDGIVLGNYLVTEGQIQYHAGNLDSARDFAMKAIRNDAGAVNIAKQDLAIYNQAIAARNQAAAAQAQHQFAADEQGLLDEIRQVQATPVVAAVPKPRNAADQLCIAAGEAADCIGKFTPHGAAPPPGASDPRAAQQADRQFTTALAALRTQPPAPATAASANGKPCALVTGFKVVGEQVRSDTAPCGAPAQADATNSGDTDEAISEAARVPFDTAVANAGSAPVPIANANVKVPLLRPVVTYMTLDRETQQLKQDACARIANLERNLARFQAALHRLASAGPMITGAQAEWEQQLDEVTKEEWGQLAGGLTSYLDARLDEKIEALNDEARRAFELRRNASSSDVREQYNIAFRALVKQRKIVVWDHDTAVALLDLWSKGYDMLELWNTSDPGERRLEALRQLSELLISQPSFKAAAAPVTIAELWINASGDLYAEWVHYKALASLNRGAEQYASGMKTLQKRIQTTSKAIQKARDEITSSRRACTAT